MAARIPSLRLSPAIPDTMPASVGPPEHPASPARASRANMAVPPPLIEAAALLKVPGLSLIHIFKKENEKREFSDEVRKIAVPVKPRKSREASDE